MASEVPSRELRNDVSAVLRRVEEGESLIVNVSGRPVARLVPLATRPTSIPTSTLLTALGRVAADAATRQRRLEDDVADAFSQAGGGAVHL